MIIDKLENIDKYVQIPVHAVDFINKLTANVELGKYKISDTDYVNVETYETKTHDKCFFEAHKNYADIQILLSGTERLDYADINNLEIKTPYNIEKDIMFLENSVKESCSVILDGTNFVFLAPEEAHRPQMSIDNNPKTVKKVVVKIKI